MVIELNIIFIQILSCNKTKYGKFFEPINENLLVTYKKQCDNMNAFSCCYRKVEVGPTFKIMATLRRESPTVHVCTSGSDAIVHIRQLIYTDDDETSSKNYWMV